MTLTKNWADTNNKYGVRPNSITLKLSYKLDGSSEFTELTKEFVDQYMTSEDAMTITGTGT